MRSGRYLYTADIDPAVGIFHNQCRIPASAGEILLFVFEHITQILQSSPGTSEAPGSVAWKICRKARGNEKFETPVEMLQREAEHV
jgi:hypothetical protein